jgi:hypothetical protein
MFVKSLSFLSWFVLPVQWSSAATVQIEDGPDAPKAAAQADLKESDLLGTYVQAGTGGILEFKPGGKLGGWPSAAASYKIVGPHRVELTQTLLGKEERIPVEIFTQKEGLILVRTVNGENETVPLHRLIPAKLDAKAWAGPCTIHVLVSGSKTATKREAKFTEDGYLRTPEGGYWLRLLADKTGERTLGFTSDLEDQTMAIYLFKVGPLLVLFDSLEKPKLLAMIQLSVK